ncbi:hypothetical protein, partial [Bacteroides thetaiotaomicron]|uniref:hypothetical protein n=1 Tax=Bacteroides thetaiotaomicron TaxID=818 RepID=UPI001E517F29
RLFNLTEEITKGIILSDQDYTCGCWRRRDQAGKTNTRFQTAYRITVVAILAIPPNLALTYIVRETNTSILKTTKYAKIPINVYFTTLKSSGSSSFSKSFANLSKCDFMK